MQDYRKKKELPFEAKAGLSQAGSHSNSDRLRYKYRFDNLFFAPSFSSNAIDNGSLSVIGTSYLLRFQLV